MYVAKFSVPTTDADLLRISEENPGWRVERDARGTVVMTPTGARSGARSSRLTAPNFPTDFSTILER